MKVQLGCLIGLALSLALCAPAKGQNVYPGSQLPPNPVIQGSHGMVIPHGVTGDAPAHPLESTLRIDTTTGKLVWYSANGGWQSAGGGSGGITAVNGTTGQINANTNSGVTTISLPNNVTIPQGPGPLSEGKYGVAFSSELTVGNANPGSLQTSLNVYGAANSLLNLGFPTNAHSVFSLYGPDTEINFPASGVINFGGVGIAPHVSLKSASPTGIYSCTMPNANSNPVQPATGSSGQFVTGIGSDGTISFDTPAGSVTSITGTANQVVVTGSSSPVLSLPNDVIIPGIELAGNALTPQLKLGSATVNVASTFSMLGGNSQNNFIQMGQAGQTGTINRISFYGPTSTGIYFYDGAPSLTFYNAANTFSTTVGIVQPTANNLIRWPNLSGTVQLSSNVGTAGQVLTSNGAGATPSFQAAGGGTPPQPSYPHAGGDTTGVALGLNALTHQFFNTLTNTAVGANVLNAANFTGSDNAALGYNALAVDTGNTNSAVGSQCLALNTSGNANSALGNYALGQNLSGSSNCAFGAGAGNVLTTGSNNTFLGAGAGYIVAATGSHNILIGGNQEDTPLSSTSNYLNLGQAIYGTGIEGGTVKIGINQAAPGYTLDVNGTLGSAVHYSTAAVTTVNGSSSGNVKWSMPEQGASYKKVVIALNAMNDAGTVVTFPTAFATTPAILNGSSCVISTFSTTSITIPLTAGVTGTIIVEGM